MTHPPRRRWFQLHLSTLIALTLTAGALLWSNVRPVIQKTVTFDGRILINRYFGWPYPTIWKDSQTGDMLWFRAGKTKYDAWPAAASKWLLLELVNSFHWLLILAGVAFFAELLARRRKRVPGE